MTIEGGALVLRPPASPVRKGWAEAAKKIAEAGDDACIPDCGRLRRWKPESPIGFGASKV
jgi:hypothetical protein